jgi:hypothetical protein
MPQPKHDSKLVSIYNQILSSETKTGELAEEFSNAVLLAAWYRRTREPPQRTSTPTTDSTHLSPLLRLRDGTACSFQSQGPGSTVLLACDLSAPINK